jgi:hypothetical protein
MGMDNGTNSNKLIEIALDRRERGKEINPGLVILEAHERGVEFDVHDVRALLRFSAQGEHHPSEKIVSEIMKLVDRPVKNILDPYAGYGLLLIPLVEQIKPIEAHAMEGNRAQSVYASMIKKADVVQWHDSNLSESDGIYDAVVSALPVPMNHEPRSPFSSKRMWGMLSARYCPMIIEASKHLTEDGMAVFLIPGPLPAVSYEKLRQSLEAEGLFIDLLMYVKSGAYEPGSLGGHIIRIGRKKGWQAVVREML